MTEKPASSTIEIDQEFGRILEESLNEIYMFDAQTLQFVLVNRGARENTGYSMKELHRLTPIDLKPEVSEAAFARMIHPLRTGRKNQICFNTKHRRKDGSLYDVEVHLQRSTCHGRAVFVAIIVDTTERRRYIADLNDRKARLQAILDTAVDAIITIDEHGICDSANRAAEELFGYQADELIGQNISMLMPPPYRDEHDDYIRAYIQSGVKKIIGIGREVVGRRKNGESFPMELAVSEVKTNGQRWFTGIVRDVTERKRAEQTIAENQRQLVQAERLAAVGEAMTSLAHESRNLLQKIQMAVEMGRLTSQEEPNLGKHLDSIEKAADGLHALLDEVRSYAAPINLDPAPTSLAEVWREAWNLVAELREGRNASLTEVVDAGDCLCNIDRFRMVQVFRNLFENSLAACGDPAEIHVGVSNSHTTSEGAALRIAVRDNGPGLSFEQQKRVFEPFFTTKSKGTGLGMAIAQRIVEAHGGIMAVEEGGGRGARFLIDLPLSDATVQGKSGANNSGGNC